VLPYIDPDILAHQIPGGMISNFRSQLEMQNALDRLPDALREMALVREDLGYPPLVTPTSQIVGTQAVMNVLAGERYKIIPNEVKDYVRGLYGRSPATIHRKMIRKILGDEQPVTGRPADRLAPMLPKATDGIEPKLIEHEEDILSYLLLPEPAVEYFKWRALPPGERPETPAEIELKKQKTETKSEIPAGLQPKMAHVSPFARAVESLITTAPPLVQELLHTIEGLSLDEIVFRKGEQTIAVRAPDAAVPAVSSPSAAAGISSAPAAASSASTAAPQEKKTAKAEYRRTINAPLVGKFYLSPGPGKRHFVKEGDTVNEGAKVCIVEAMKLFNEITAPVKCRIVKILAEEGKTVEKNQPLIAIEELK
jgi:oxaloacetate decarboxylase alpha subunit